MTRYSSMFEENGSESVLGIYLITMKGTRLLETSQQRPLDAFSSCSA